MQSKRSSQTRDHKARGSHADKKKSILIRFNSKKIKVYRTEFVRTQTYREVPRNTEKYREIRRVSGKEIETKSCKVPGKMALLKTADAVTLH